MKDDECRDHWRLTREAEKEIEMMKSNIDGMRDLINYKIDDLFLKFKGLAEQRRDVKKGLLFPSLLMLVNITAIIIITVVK